MTGIRRRVAAIALLLLSGCETIAGTQTDQSLWQALEIKNYDFVYRVSCFCGFPGPNPAKISVRGGVVTKVQPASDTAVAGINPVLSAYPTIDSLFVILQKAQKNTPDGVTVEFDPTYHFPSKIFIDP